jgi:hypothetical protein
VSGQVQQQNDLSRPHQRGDVPGHTADIQGVRRQNMRPIILILALLGLGLFAACGGPANDNQAIIDATTTYVKANAAVTNFTVQVEQVDGDYARARVTPTDGSTDTAWVFLKRQDGVWTGLIIGTAFLPENYQQLGIPKSLQI